MTADRTTRGSLTVPDPRGARQWVLLLVLSGNMLLDAVEVSVVLLALPTIGGALGMSLPEAQWLMSGFALGFAALLVLGPWICARLGRRRAYLGAMLLFVVASVAGGTADSEALLVASRVVKGVCAALTAPTGLAVIATTFEEGPRRRRAVSVYALFGAVGFTAGLLLSAAFLAVNWRWTFLFPAPVALVLLLLAARTMTEEPGEGRRVTWVKPSLLRDGRLRNATIGAATLNGGYVSLLLMVTFDLQQRLGWSPWRCALALLPACVPLAVTVPFAGRLTARFGTEKLITAGASTSLLGYALYLLSPETRPYWSGTLPTLLLVETGFVLSFAALNMQATAGIRPAERGLAVPLYQTGVQLGAAVMLPLVAVLVTVRPTPRAATLAITAAGALGLLAALAGLRGGALRRPGEHMGGPVHD
ncbi:MFS transporter [Streptosporangium jomthongense]|uniref:MFS transporter n=1 Tax=Streptosporangium jomthongense TaxID=1193683 RepID=A0ABV8ETJ9_9ACTN